MKNVFAPLILLISLFHAVPALSVPLINGISIHSELGQESFIGAILSDTLTTNSTELLTSNEEKQIQVRVLANRLSARRFRRLWIEGLAINASTRELEEQSRNMADFSNMLKVSMTKGDIFAVQRDTTSVKVIINGSTLGEIEDPNFFDLLLRTWIGPVPLSSTFRDGLLVGGEVDEELIQKFNGTVPSDDRIKAIASALAEQEEEEKAASAPAVASAVAVAPVITQPSLTAKPDIKAPVIGAAPSLPAPAAAEVSVTGDLDAEEPVKEEGAQLEASAEDSATKEAVDVATITERENLEEIIFEEDEEEFTAESLLAQQLYIAKLKKWTYKELNYPTRSLQKNEQGIVRLSVTVNREGMLQEISVSEESEYARLTKAAIKAVEKSEPYPAMPDEVSGYEFQFSMPIVFRIVDG